EMKRRRHLWIDLGERFESHIAPREGQRALGEKHAAGAVILAHHRVGGYVAAADVLGKRLPHQQPVEARIELRARRVHKRSRTTPTLPSSGSPETLRMR